MVCCRKNHVESCCSKKSADANFCNEFGLIMTDKKAEAVKAKTEGNKHFKAKNYDKAIESYTKAVELDPEKVGCIQRRTVF